MIKNSVIINVKGGLHTRIAAMIVNRSSQLKGRLSISLYIKSKDYPESLAISMLALLSLKIKQGEKVAISCIEDSIDGNFAVMDLCQFISNINEEDSGMSSIDAIIEDNIIVNEGIIKKLPIGVIVIDINSNITTINEYGMKLIGKTLSEVTGKFVKDVIPTTDLPNILNAQKYHTGKIQHINNHIVIVNRSPIYSGSKVSGAVGVFQDISELVGLKELNERFKKILETTHDLICFVDEERKISYVNPSYEKFYDINSSDILGHDLIDISPNGFRMQVFNSREKLEDHIFQTGSSDIVASVDPIFIDNVFKGVISISKPVKDIRDLNRKLEKSQEELNYYKEELKRYNKLGTSFDSIIGSSSSLHECLIIAQKASDSTSTVLVRGESGTGKELVAKAIHNAGSRKDKPFVRVNCAAIPESLLESELFGYEKGAFTGAVKNKPGKFNIANEGTIFLDEIGDMPKSMQVKLLRVLQEREFESVGGIITQKVDVRIIAATNRNLEEMLKSSEFREDLYYRLNVIPIVLPPLRDRKEDINSLTEHFIEKISRNLNKRVTGIENDCYEYLQNYQWPGNIRELENIIERSINMCDGEIISSSDLPFYITNIAPRSEKIINLINGEILPLEVYEKEIITLAMSKYKSFNRAGKALGLTHRTVSLKCIKYGINK